MMTKIKIFVLLFAFAQHSCENSSPSTVTDVEYTSPEVVPQSEEDGIILEKQGQSLLVGAEQMEQVLQMTTNKRLGLVVNQTSVVDNTHLVDTLLSHRQLIKTIFAPEHGFRGTADAGETVTNGKDEQTGIPVISLYGKNKEPQARDLAEIDLLIFDIQDVGARFYTYISTLHYVLQAAAKKGIPVLVLDRPNPNIHIVDGPVLDLDYQSFVGMHPIPVLHGMTIGEYAKMINGQGWLDDGLKAEVLVLPCANYTRNTAYDLPIPPSPNLPNMRSIYLYPSLCFFEGTVFSVGRGTSTQFQVYGHPDFAMGNYQFTPQSGPGAKYPKLEGKTCNGISFTKKAPESIRAEGQINLFYLLQAYSHFPDQANFFLKNKFIDKLAGGPSLREQVQAGWTESQIRASWQEDLTRFRQMRAPYLLYE